MKLKDVGKFLSKNSPNILTALSIIGVISTTVMASQATIKAKEVVDEMEPRDKKETFKIAWKFYIPTALSAGTTIGCILGSRYCSIKQNEVLTSAYLLSQTTLREYQKKVIERIGKNKEKDIREEVVKELGEAKAPIALYSEGGYEVIDTHHGNTLFYDVPGDRYFKSDINYLKSQENAINHDLRTEMWYDWNEISYRWGLPFKKYGSELIIDVDRPLEVRYVPEMMDNGQVRILVDYDLYPREAT